MPRCLRYGLISKQRGCWSPGWSFHFSVEGEEMYKSLRPVLVNLHTEHKKDWHLIPSPRYSVLRFLFSNEEWLGKTESKQHHFTLICYWTWKWLFCKQCLRRVMSVSLSSLTNHLKTLLLQSITLLVHTVISSSQERQEVRTQRTSTFQASAVSDLLT